MCVCMGVCVQVLHKHEKWKCDLRFSNCHPPLPPLGKWLTVSKKHGTDEESPGQPIGTYIYMYVRIYIYVYYTYNGNAHVSKRMYICRLVFIYIYVYEGT